MRVWNCGIKIIVLSALAVWVSADVAFAQKQLRYLPKAFKTPKVPVVVNPRLPLSTRARLATINQAVNAAAARAQISKTKAALAADAAPATAKVFKEAARRDTHLPKEVKLSNFLTGPQALAAYMPGWKGELRSSVFTEEQLNVIEQTFKETDKTLFKLDEDGNWLAPADGSTEWEYETWFSIFLDESPVKFTDAQLKTLFGQKARFDDVFTRLNYQAFLLVNQRAPKTNAPGEEGKLARHVKYNLDKRDGRKMNPEVEEYVYGNMPAKLKTPKPSYGPKGRAPRRNPEQVWEEVTQFIREQGRIPSQLASDDYERKLRSAWNYIYQAKQTSNDPYAVRLIKLHKEMIREKNADRTPQEVLDATLVFMQEHGGKLPSQLSQDAYEKALRLAGNYIYYQHKDKTPQELAQLEEVVQQICKLFRENVKEFAARRTPQEVLDDTLAFMREHGGTLPSQHSQDAYEKSLRNAGNWIYLQHKNDTPQELAQLEEAVQQIVKLFRENMKYRTAQEVLDDTLVFMKEHGGKLPLELSQDPYERALRLAGGHIWQKYKDKTPQELAQLEEPVRQIVKLFRENVMTYKTAQEVLDDTLVFMQEHGGKLPLQHSQDAYEKSLRWAGDRIYYPHKDKTPQELAQLEEPVQQIVKLFRENVRGYTKK